MIKLKFFSVGDSDYEEQMEQFQNEHPNSEFLQITGGHMSHEKIWFKYEDDIKKPKLSIPKKIAEELDGFNPNEGETKIELLIVGYYKSFLSDELMSFCLDDNGLNLCAFYLASKALGVELVEVEG